ncbi:hypothetical protein [Burkholderia sp. RF4-BP95]|uniref:hypothetical protein n=1 Tax=Burkholderia sp. RF4-BP95 TaxID=1637845 RepID=UPI000753D487|nr:hypothetical protein [Burkholderia sp. RF4-BP95]KUY86210.1 hypothetical protein WS46_05010 [Burkholderia sp. RF4-BP95]
MRRLVHSLLGLLWILAGPSAAPGAWATTTLTFDDVPTGSLTNQYQSLGVMASGVDVANAAFTVYAANTPPNIAFAPNGLMTFTIDPTVIGNVQSISAYIGPSTTTTLSAYDASGALVGQTVLPASPTYWNLAPASVTSSGNPIVSVQIQGGASDYAIDTLTFATDVPFAKYAATVYLAPKVSYFSATETFTLGAASIGINPPAQAVTLTFGTLSLTIPPGSFAKDLPPRGSSYVYQGALNGGILYVSIKPTKTPNTYQLFALGSGYAIPSGLSTMPVSLSIGDSDGHTTVTPNYVQHVPTSP